MNDNTRNAFASYGLEILKRSVLLVLLVLYEARDEGFIPQRKIREQLGIARVDPKDGNWNSLFWGILSYLKADDLTHHKVRSGWQITEKGV